MNLPIYNEKVVNKKVIIAIAAGKGGVGKSTVCVHIAQALHDRHFKVGILDADIYGPSCRKMLKEQEMPMKKFGRFEPADSQGIKLMSMAYFNGSDQSISVRAPIANQLISQFIHDVNWSEVDILLVDFPPGTGDIHLTLMQQLQFSGAIVVTTPQEVSALDVLKAIDLFEKMDVSVLGFVENMSYWQDPNTQIKHYIFGSGAHRVLSSQKKLECLGQIPVDSMLSDCGDQGCPINRLDPQHPLSLIFAEISQKIC